MKTLKKISTLLLLVIAPFFTSSQTVVETPVFTYGDYVDAQRSQDESYLLVTVSHTDYPTNACGEAKVLEKQADGSYELVQHYYLPRGPSNVASVELPTGCVLRDGTSFVKYMYDWASGNSIKSRMQKNFLDGSSETLFESVGQSGYMLTPFEDNIYLIFYVYPDAYFITNNGNFPQLAAGTSDSPKRYLMKINGETKQYVWSIPMNFETLSGNHGKIIENPADTNFVYFNTPKGKLLKYRRDNGEYLGVVKEGADGNRFKFKENGDLYFLHKEDTKGGRNMKLTIFSSDSDYESIIYETDWEEWGLWDIGLADWKTIDDQLYGVCFSHTLHLSKELVHGYTTRLPQMERARWVNDDKSYTGVKAEENYISVVTSTIPEEDESLIPSLNDQSSNVIAVFDGQTFDGENWVNAYHQSTIVFKDGTLPAIGSDPSENWVVAASGTHKIILFPVFESSNGKGPVFIGVYRVDGTADYDINIRVYLKEESEVTLPVNYDLTLQKMSDGAEPNLNPVFKICLNTANVGDAPITGEITYSGSATPGEDYEAGPDSFSIAPGESCAFIELNVLDDNEYEGDETVSLTISDASAGDIVYAFAEAKITDNETSGMGEAQKEAVFLSPNPARNYISLFSLSKIKKVKLYTITGKEQYLQRTPRFNKFDIAHLMPGIYLINIQLENGKLLHKRFIKN